MTTNATHAGHRNQSAFATFERQTLAITTLTMNASIACTLGMAAYGFAAQATRPLSWFNEEYCASVSMKPHSGNIRGGAVGTTMYPTRPTRFAPMSQLRKPANRS